VREGESDMDATWAIGVYAIVITSFALSILAVYYAFRLSRITGLFGAWTFLIWGLALTGFEDFASFGSVIFLGYNRVVNVAATFSLAGFLFEALILIAPPAFFFGAMYKLHGMFRSQKERQVPRTRLESPPIAE
jgi:hypothetical protein